MNLAIIAVAYNRKKSLSRLLDSLEKAYYNQDVTLIISIDKSDTDIVERFGDDYYWPHGNKIVDKHEKNLGLRTHMLSLGKWFDNFDALVVLEDDIVVSPNFYTYAYQAVSKYHNNHNIAGISLYGIAYNGKTNIPFTPMKNENDAYFMNYAISWGEVWMRDSWKRFFDWYSHHIDFPIMAHLPHNICLWNEKSWLKYHIRYCIEENKYFVFPYTSLSTNFSDKGEHWSSYENTVYQVPLQQGNMVNFRLPDFGSEGVYYDGFFENKTLYDVLGISENDLCLDLQGELNNRLNKRYWLTCKKANYKIVKSFGLNYRPIEQNIILDTPGERIFLYDTENKRRNNCALSRDRLYHFYITNMFVFLIQYGIKNLWLDFRDYLYLRIKK